MFVCEMVGRERRREQDDVLLFSAGLSVPWCDVMGMGHMSLCNTGSAGKHVQSEERVLLINVLN